MSFRMISEGIYKEDIPFEDGYTSFFAFENGGEWAVMDFGASFDDGINHIIPSIREMGFYPKYLLCSHTHGDHIGGAEAVCSYFENVPLMKFSPYLNVGGKMAAELSDGQILFGRFKLLNLKGHTDDGLGVLDIKENILVSGDGLQLYGGGRYGTNISNPGGYIETLNRLKKLNLNGIISSHSYEPLGAEAFGKASAVKYIETCKEAFDLIVRIINENKEKNSEEIAKIYNAENLPTLSSWTVDNIAEYLKQNK